MPDALANIYGVNDGSAAGLAMSGIFFLMGPLVLLTYVIGLGLAVRRSVKRKPERCRSCSRARLRRRSILLAKTAVAAIGVRRHHRPRCGSAWRSSAGPLGMDLSDQGTFAAAVQLLGMVLLFGALALGISAWRGSSRSGIGVAAGLALVSYFITTLLPVGGRAGRPGQAHTLVPAQRCRRAEPRRRRRPAGDRTRPGRRTVRRWALYALDRRDLKG